LELSRCVYRFFGNRPQDCGHRKTLEPAMKPFTFIAIGWVAASTALALLV
jgi:hypothetical protein